jgi:xanthine dehydrogenase YagS FAD-binding subunit
MNRFSYERASSVDGAIVSLAGNPRAQIIAGGSNLIDLIKYNVEKPECLIDITRIEGLSDISETADGGLRVGAMVTNAALAIDSRVIKRFPLLASALLAGATPQLRNAATTGGNLNQRTRCYYFYDTATPCNKREPGTGCPAIKGLNRIHAILGTSEHCIATHPSDMCVALAALGAIVHVTGPNGDRAIPISAYHRLPGETPQFDSTLEHGEVVTSVELPGASQVFASHFTYLKLRDRLSYAFALVSVAAAIDLDGGIVRQARIALGGVAHKPWRREEAEALLIGKPAGAATFALAADALLAGARGFEHNLFKIELTRRAIIRGLTQAAAGTPQSSTDKRIA